MFVNLYITLTISIQDALLELIDDIGAHLEYFRELEQATRMLNHPGEALIFEADFLYMVERVDICIDFLKGHVNNFSLLVFSPWFTSTHSLSQRHFKEAEVYLLRFQQCMTRAMTLIKMNFVGSLRALSSEVTKRLSEKAARSSIYFLHYSSLLTNQFSRTCHLLPKPIFYTLDSKAFLKKLLLY